MPITEFFTGVLQTVVEPDELVTEIIIPRPADGSSSIYYKYALRKALDLAMVGVASCVLLDSEGVVKDAKIGLGAVAVVPKRAYNAEGAYSGQEAHRGAHRRGRSRCQPAGLQAHNRYSRHCGIPPRDGAGACARRTALGRRTVRRRNRNETGYNPQS